MTYQYTLADKMRNQFRGRGASLSGMQASSTSELVRRAGMGHDPRVNCAQQAFREQQARRNGSRNEYSRNDAMYTSVYSTVPGMNRTQKNTRTHNSQPKAQQKTTQHRKRRRRA